MYSKHNMVASYLPILFLILGVIRTSFAQTLCDAECIGTGSTRSCTYEFSVDVFASETGYFKVKGCTGVNPTLTMEPNVEYKFVQTDVTNWMHPLGFGYYPDGAHEDVDELEPGVNPYDPSCVSSMTCQSPMYYGGSDGNTFLGVLPVSTSEDFGLDVYEPLFQRARGEWIEMEDMWNIRLTITDPNTEDFFYICHVHNKMSGRIKVLDDSDNRNVRSTENVPELGYKYHTLTAFDQDCGTYGVGKYADSEKMCPEAMFLCDVKGSEQEEFGHCMNALDCAMHVEMANSNNDDPAVTFMHQMIPHHQNAVNMAKALLKTDTLSSENDPDGEIEEMLWEVINGQNKQITFMRKWLKAYDYPENALCEDGHGNKGGNKGKGKGKNKSSKGKGKKKDKKKGKGKRKNKKNDNKKNMRH